MPINRSMYALMNLEMLAWVVLAILYSKRPQLSEKFPITKWYFYVRAVTSPFLLFELYFQTMSHGVVKSWIASYRLSGYIIYFICTVLLFFISREIFHAVMDRYSVINKVGLVLLYGVAGSTVIFSVGRNMSQFVLFMKLHGIQMLIPLSHQMICVVSLIELAVLSFLCVGMNSLRLSVRDASFGLTLGFGMLAALDFLMATTVTGHHLNINDPAAYLAEFVTLCVLGIWITYSLLPERKESNNLVPSPSMIMRLNEIATVLNRSANF